MKNVIVQFSRIFVGLLFIISGLIKLNDPIGFSYKLAEYFSEPVLNLPFLVPYALALAIAIVIFEAMLGFMLLIGTRIRFTVWSLLLMIVFFSFLTFYSAYYNKVTDCGCFGDALHLTPWQSFTKDAILLFFILILFLNMKMINPLSTRPIRGILAGLALVGCGIMAYWVINHLPLKDFRAYKVGTNINTAMRIPDNAQKSVVEMIFIYKVNGVDKEFSEKDLALIPTGATFVDRKDKVITEGYKPPIHDFSIEKDGIDYTQEILSKPKVIIIVAYDLEKARPRGMRMLQKMSRHAVAKGYYVLGLTASSPELIKQAKKKYNLSFDFFFSDGTTLKTIERANPSIVVLENGTITKKVHYNDISELNL